MSIEIKIGLGDDAVSATALDQHMAALGFVRSVSQIAISAATQPPVDNDHVETGARPFTSEEVTANAPKRERGKPSAGRARRTKEEIAEDDAADAAEAAAQEPEAEEPASISTGENRVSPEDDVDEADAAQDAADEQAEADAVAEERVEKTGKALTHDDIRKALGEYVTKFGMAAAQQDGPKLITKVCGDGKAKISDIPDDQAVLASVVAGVREMLEKNPFGREPV